MYSGRILSWYNPPPFDAPIRYPRRIPPTLIKSYIGDPGCVLNLLIHEGSGGIIKDYSGYGNHGRLMPNYPINAPRWTDENLAGWASSFDGVDDYVQVPTSSSLQSPAVTNALTIPVWLFLRSAPAVETYIVSHNNTFYELVVPPTRNLRLYLGDGVNTDGYASGYIIPLNEWHRLSVTADGTNVRFYIDGLLVNTIAQVRALGVFNTPLNIGIRSPPIWNYIDSIIAMLSIYNTALSPDRIKDQYESTRAMFGV